MRMRAPVRVERSTNSKEVKMKGNASARAVVVMSLALGLSLSARAAGTFTLECDAARSGAITIALTGFNVVVTGTGEGAVATGKSAGRTETKFALTVQFDTGKDYETFLSMMDDNEILRSCKLIDGAGGGVTASDSWTEMNAKGKNKSKTNQPASATGGALEWILTNATVTSVTATGSQNTAGAPVTSMQATIEAEKFSFAM
jgi:hypothetical protein